MLHWPQRPVDEIPADEFRPPFCPRSQCTGHRHPELAGFRYHRHGNYLRKSDRRVVPRFRCLLCEKTFSQQTFSPSYYLKRQELLTPVAAGLQAGSAHRQLARSLGCAPSTVTRLSARLGRHSILLHSLALEKLDGIHEPIVHDDFETFAFSQDLPCGISTSVGQRSWFVYSLQFAPHRRGGPPRRRPTGRSAARTAPIARGAYARAFRDTLDILLEIAGPGASIDIVSDAHPGYRSGLRSHPRRHRVRHHVFPNPKRHPGRPRSPEARARDRAMWVTDYLHMFLRHTFAHVRRETVAFARRHNALMERAFLFVAWRNFVKRRSERRPEPVTPAVRLGLTDAPWSWSRLLGRRLFPTRTRVPEPWMRIYRREILTPEVGPNRIHALAHAF